MTACALCLRPLAGASVHEPGASYHPRCHAVFSKYRLGISKAKATITRAEREALEHRQDAARARIDLQTTESELQRERTARREAQAEVKNLREQLAAERERNRTDRQEREIAVRRQAELLAENDWLRSELNVQRIGTGQPAVARTENKAETKQSPATDDRDPSVIRAELLELD